MRRRLPFARTLIGLSLGLVLFVGLVAAFGRIDRVVVASGKLVGGTTAVRAARAGVVQRIEVELGDAVEAGDLLVVLDGDAIDAERRAAEAGLEVLHARRRALQDDVERLSSELHPSALAQARLERQAQELRLAGAQRRAETLRRLQEQGLARTIEAEDAELSSRVAAVELEGAEGKLEYLGLSQAVEVVRREEELEELDARIGESRVRLEELDRLRSRSSIVAPVAGVVTGGDPARLRGRHVDAGDELLRISHRAADRFEGRVGDLGRPFAAPGLDVKIRLDAYPWLLHGSVPGRVAFVADHKTDAGFLASIAVAADDGDGPGPLYEGMAGEARIVVEEDVSIGRLLLEKILGEEGP